MLCGAKVFMSEHFTDTLNRHTVGQRDRSGECMSGDMEREFFVDFAAIGDFFQVRIHLLIAEYRQQPILVQTLRMLFVFLQKLQSRWQQGDVGARIRFLSVRENPFLAVDADTDALA